MGERNETTQPLRAWAVGTAQALIEGDRGGAWYVFSYPFKTWRCRLFGHQWGPEQHDYEPNTGTHMESWRNCERRGCEGWWETYHYMAGGKQRVLG